MADAVGFWVEGGERAQQAITLYDTGWQGQGE